jgi:hypothetical protein
VSRHSGPDFTVPPDDQRCEALVKGKSAPYFEWQREDHRCPRRAVQCRGPIAVCPGHARAKFVCRFDDKEVWQGIRKK